MRHSKSPQFTLGTSKRVDIGSGKEGKAKPGPGRYNQTIDFKKSAPKFAFGKELRPEMSRSRQQFSPGPGTYEGKNITGNDGPALSMSPMYHDKFKQKRDKLVPGPGQYNNQTDTKKNAPKYGIGTSKRMDLAKSHTTKGLLTDAGLYNPDAMNVKNTSPNYRFGS